MQNAGVYEDDPDRAPDDAFVAGTLRHLVAGNAGRLLDARRTPVTVVGVDAATGLFDVRVDAFEDRGAVWRLPFEQAGRFQFALSAALADDATAGAYEDAVRRLDRPLTVAAGAGGRARTLARVAAERDRAAAWLAGRDGVGFDLDALVAERIGSPEASGLCTAFLDEAGVGDLDRAFAEMFVSNPGSGELVKGHAIVLAELGLCPYAGTVIRSPDLFTGAWSRERRARHLVCRLAFVHALWARAGHDEATLYRGMAVDGALGPRPAASFVSATFSRDVALEHFAGGPTTRTAAMFRQVVPAGRLFMTFVETEAMSRQFREAEAVLVGDPRNAAF